MRRRIHAGDIVFLWMWYRGGRHLDDPAVIVREEFVRANPGKDSQKSAPQHIYRVESLSRVLFENMDHCASLGHSSFRRP